MSEQRPLQTAGEMLAEGRLRLSSTVEQVATATKIPISILQAIELDEYHKLSDPLYIKSFLRTYAQHLGLDSEVVLQVYQQFAGEKSEPVAGDEAVWEEEVKIQRVGLHWRSIALYAAGAAVLVCVGLFLVLRGCGSDGSDVLDVQDVQDVQDVTPAVPQQRGEIVDESPGQDLRPSEGTETIETTQKNQTPHSSQELEQEPVSSLPDTLSWGWQQGSDPLVPEKLPEKSPDRQEETVADQPAPQPVQPDVQPSDLPANLGVVFADGRSWPVVLRLQCQSPVGVAVQRDAERNFRIVFWTDDPNQLPGDSDDGVEHGRAYVVGEGLVVYWGAQDHFILRLDQVQGVRVSVNGQERDVSTWSPGDEMLLDDGSHRSGLPD